MIIRPCQINLTPKQSEVLQQFLFNNNYCWMSGEKRIKYTTSGTLYLTEKGITTSYRFSQLSKTTFDDFMIKQQRKEKLEKIERYSINL